MLSARLLLGIRSVYYSVLRFIIVYAMYICCCSVCMEGRISALVVLLTMIINVMKKLKEDTITSMQILPREY